MFLVVLLGTGLTEAAPAIAWAALVGGGYFGGFVALSAATARIERQERSSRSVTSPVGSQEQSQAA